MESIDLLWTSKVKVKQRGHAHVEVAKSSSFATRRRSQKHPVDNSSVHKDTVWGDPQHAWIPHGSGVRAMDMGLGMFSLIVLVRGEGGDGWLDLASPHQVN